MSDNYLGYRLKIGNTIIYSKWIAPGSYSATPKERIVATWLDADQKTHRDVVSTGKMEIVFSVRERSKAEQAEIATIFSSYNNLSVTYWDDRSAVYRTGLFFMTPPTFKHKNAQAGSITYDPTQIKLTEY